MISCFLNKLIQQHQGPSCRDDTLFFFAALPSHFFAGPLDPMQLHPKVADDSVKPPTHDTLFFSAVAVPVLLHNVLQARWT
jgi:hypothetical protein